MFDLITLLKNRYAAKVYDPAKPVSMEQIDVLLESLRLTPSSVNSQPWHFFVISQQTLKEQLAEAAWSSNQQKFVDAPFLIVFAARTEYNVQDCKNVMEAMAKDRNQPLDEDRLKMMTNYVEGMDGTHLLTWARQQVYLALGQFLTACPLLGLDATPVEGADFNKVDQILKLNEKGYSSTVMALIGHHDKGDFNHPSKAIKSRLPLNQVVSKLP